MKNFKLGSIGGIPIYANLTLVLFLPVLAWMFSRPAQIDVYAGLIESLTGQPVDVDALGEGDTPLVIGGASAIGLMVGVLVHELGHAWAARRYDIVISSITLWIFGGMAHMEDLPERWDVEFWVALAGPVTSVLLSVAFFGALQVTPASSPVLTFVVAWLAVVNLSLAVFNMVPAFPMDGGRIYRALLARRSPYVTATQRAARLAKVLAALGAILAIFGGAPLLILVSMFVYVAATQESRATVLRALLTDFTVRDLYHADPRTVGPDTTVAEFQETVFAERTTAFPVVDDAGEIRGLVTLDHVTGVPQSGRATTTISDLMDADPLRVDLDADAFEFVLSLGERGTDRALVVDGERLVGIVSESDVADAVSVLQGLGPVDRSLDAPEGYA